MFFDWNGNGKIDPMDIGITLAMIDEEERLHIEEEDENGNEETSIITFDSYDMDKSNME